MRKIALPFMCVALTVSINTKAESSHFVCEETAKKVVAAIGSSDDSFGKYWNDLTYEVQTRYAGVQLSSGKIDLENYNETYEIETFGKSAISDKASLGKKWIVMSKLAGGCVLLQAGISPVVAISPK